MSTSFLSWRAHRRPADMSFRAWRQYHLRWVERRHQRDPGVGHDPLIVEADLYAVQSDRPVIMHHTGDLVTSGPASHSAALPCSGRHSSIPTGQNRPTGVMHPGWA